MPLSTLLIGSRLDILSQPSHDGRVTKAKRSWQVKIPICLEEDPLNAQIGLIISRMFLPTPSRYQESNISLKRNKGSNSGSLTGHHLSNPLGLITLLRTEYYCWKYAGKKEQKLIRDAFVLIERAS
ncbi:hypothetical protein TESG_08436 [Trichophyton tonsurans CBS 112818]|uniref:Uncharacterized protein n=1 Tax=Trichophyton tonsurans (strain CBS 112818) TaxID=647933 RepID=F2RYE6_TRIT1|nr:hypothetical protein TESG_08436 [Trichophyton tonsurans CBS 112818]